jgi:hypothetical protein
MSALIGICNRAYKIITTVQDSCNKGLSEILETSPGNQGYDLDVHSAASSHQVRLQVRSFGQQKVDGKHDFVAESPPILHACHGPKVAGLKVSYIQSFFKLGCIYSLQMVINV